MAGHYPAKRPLRKSNSSGPISSSIPPLPKFICLNNLDLANAATTTGTAATTAVASRRWTIAPIYSNIWWYLILVISFISIGYHLYVKHMLYYTAIILLYFLYSNSFIIPIFYYSAIIYSILLWLYIYIHIIVAYLTLFYSVILLSYWNILLLGGQAGGGDEGECALLHLLPSATGSSEPSQRVGCPPSTLPMVFLAISLVLCRG